MLEAEPQLMLGIRFHQPGRLMAVVELVGAPIRIPGLAHDQNVGLQTERIGIDGHGANIDIGVVAWGLAGGRAVEIPFRELLRLGDWFVERLLEKRLSKVAR